MDSGSQAKLEVRSWLLRYLVEEVWEAFRSSESATVQLDRRIMCLAEAIIDHKELPDETDCVLQHFVGFVFHLSFLVERIGSGQLDEEVLNLIGAASRHWSKLQPSRNGHLSEPEYDLLDDLKLQAILSFVNRSGKRDAGSVLCDKLWPGECLNAKRTKMRNIISVGLVLAKEPDALKHDITAALAIVHASLPDCLLLELAGIVRASGHSQSIVCNPLSSRFSAESLVKSYWRKKLLLPPASKSNSLCDRRRTSVEVQTEDISEAASAQPDRLAVRLRQRLADAEQQVPVGSAPLSDTNSRPCSPVDDLAETTLPSASSSRPSRACLRLSSHCFADVTASSDSEGNGEESAMRNRPPLHTRHRDDQRRGYSNSCRERRSRDGTTSSRNNAEIDNGGIVHNRVRRAAAGAAPVPAMHGGKRQRGRWSPEDEEHLYLGVQKYGCSKWLLIKHRQGLLHKTAVQIKDKWRNLTANADRMRALEAALGPLASDANRPSSYRLRSVAP